MNLKAGTRVINPRIPAWGVGKVLEVGDDYVVTFFEHKGRTQLKLDHAVLSVVSGAEAHSPVLDNLAQSTVAGKAPYQSLPEAIGKFLASFPQGFEDGEFLRMERDDKLEASQLAQNLLSEPALATLIAAEDFAGIWERARRLESKTNLLAVPEKIKFQAALHQAIHQKSFALALYSDLYGPDRRRGFEQLAVALAGMGVPKWTAATYFGFLVHPASRVFIKPEITKNSASASGWEIDYSPDLNWRTYDRVHALAKHLGDELSKAGLKVRDMIDVQSFMWCIAPH